MTTDRHRLVDLRDMDALEVEIREANEVWVKFETFRAGAETWIPTDSKDLEASE